MIGFALVDQGYIDGVSLLEEISQKERWYIFCSCDWLPLVNTLIILGKDLNGNPSNHMKMEFFIFSY